MYAKYAINISREVSTFCDTYERVRIHDSSPPSIQELISKQIGKKSHSDADIAQRALRESAY